MGLGEEQRLYLSMVSAGPGHPGFQPRTMPRFPAAPHASPAPPSGPMVGLTVKVTDKTQPAQEQGPILLSKLFLSSSQSRKPVFPGQETGFFITKAQGSRLHSEAVLSMCPLSLCYLLSCLLVWHFCQDVSRTGQNCTPPPLPPAGSLVSALDTKTNRLCALAPYSIQGRGEGGFGGVVAANIPAM